MRAMRAYGEGEGVSRRLPRLVAERFGFGSELVGEGVSAPINSPKPRPQEPDPKVQLPETPYADPLEERIVAWVSGDLELLGASDEALKRASYRLFVESIDWDVQGVPPFVRERVLKDRSLNFEGSPVQLGAGQGARPLAVRIGLPPEQGRDGSSVDARTPFLMAYQASKGDQSEIVGWRDGCEPKNHEEYGRLADLQDYIHTEALDQIDAVWGGRAQQAAWLVRATVNRAVDMSYSVLPAELTVDAVLAWLKDLAARGIDEARDLLKYASSWKGDPYLADAYSVHLLIEVLENIEQTVEVPEAVLEAQHQHLYKTTLAGAKAAKEVRARLDGSAVLRLELSRMLEEHLGPKVSMNAVQVLSRAMQDLADDMRSEMSPTNMRNAANLLEATTSECLDWIREQGEGYGVLVQALDERKRGDATALRDAVKRVETAIERADQALRHRQAETADVAGARGRALDELDKLQQVLGSIGGGVE